MYFNGNGVVQDYVTAVKWFTKAAQQGYASAQFNLGLMYFNGQWRCSGLCGGSQVVSQSRTTNAMPAQYNLGVMYHNGDGVVQDYVMAHVWYNLAGARGDEQARENRDRIAQKMTRDQIAEAQRLAREWKPVTARTK